MKLEVLPLTREAFRPYGDVIETEGQDFIHINDGKVRRFLWGGNQFWTVTEWPGSSRKP